MKVGILFDLDGTLLNSLEDLKDSVNYMLGQHGLPQRSLDEIRSFVGNGARRLIALSLPGGQDDPDVDQALKEYQAYYATHSQIKTKPYDGILEALAEVGEKYPVAVVSNKPDVAVKPLCRDYFPGIYALGETPDCPRKPAPDMLQVAMKALEVDTCVYVGDSEVDVLTAINAGVPCLSVLWGFRDRETLQQAGGKYFCDKVSDMPQMLEKIVGEVYGE